VPESVEVERLALVVLDREEVRLLPPFSFKCVRFRFGQPCLPSRL
jgi:hypothetical protein